MKSATIFALSSLVSVLSLAGCVAGEEDMVDPDIVEADEIGKVSQAKLSCVTPPMRDATVVQAHDPAYWSLTNVSSPDGTYYGVKGNYVVEVTNVLPSSEAHAGGTNSVSSKAACESTTTTATLYGFHDLLGCWIKIGGTKSKTGVYRPQDELMPEACEDGVSWDIPAPVSKVRIEGKSVQQTAFGPFGRMITEGTWHTF